MTEARTTPIVLASQSASRRRMLAAAGVAFEALASTVDEAALKAEFDARETVTPETPIRIARHLAAAKALDVSRQRPGRLVIGSDQTLWFEMWGGGNAVPWMLSKAATLEQAREHLKLLAGKTHHLCSAVAIAVDGAVVWQREAVADMTVRAMSDTFLDDYLAAAGPSLLGSVGCYQLEGAGVQLFEDISGDFFTILGMPLLPLLGELRARGALAI